MVWTPTLRLLIASEPPLPKAPSILEVQAIAPVRVPSSSSLAVPVNVISAPSSTEVLLPGAVI